MALTSDRERDVQSQLRRKSHSGLVSFATICGASDTLVAVNENDNSFGLQ